LGSLISNHCIEAKTFSRDINIKSDIKSERDTQLLEQSIIFTAQERDTVVDKCSDFDFTYMQQYHEAAVATRPVHLCAKRTVLLVLNTPQSTFKEGKENKAIPM
jgi:hypothetical protein